MEVRLFDLVRRVVRAVRRCRWKRRLRRPSWTPAGSPDWGFEPTNTQRRPPVGHIVAAHAPVHRVRDETLRSRLLRRLAEADWSPFSPEWQITGPPEFVLSSFQAPPGGVAVARLPDGVAVKDAKKLSLPQLTYTFQEWQIFLAEAKAGRFDFAPAM
jgi:hypothetical protein